MPTKRLDIDNDEVLSYLKKVNGSIAQAARKFGCCSKVIRNIRDGKRDWYLEAEIPQEDPEGDGEQPLCTNCGTRRKAPHLRYLCMTCYRRCGDGESDVCLTTPSSRKGACL
jgi:hypothetical protein